MAKLNSVQQQFHDALTYDAELVRITLPARLMRLYGLKHKMGGEGWTHTFFHDEGYIAFSVSSMSNGSTSWAVMDASVDNPVRVQSGLIRGKARAISDRYEECASLTQIALRKAIARAVADWIDMAD